MFRFPLEKRIFLFKSVRDGWFCFLLTVYFIYILIRFLFICWFYVIYASFVYSYCSFLTVGRWFWVDKGFWSWVDRVLWWPGYILDFFLISPEGAGDGSVNSKSIPGRNLDFPLWVLLLWQRRSCEFCSGIFLLFEKRKTLQTERLIKVSWLKECLSTPDLGGS